MAAEVINLQRSVLITGDDPDFNTPNSGSFLVGFHTGTFHVGTPNDSIYDIRYTRLENCGQKNILGRYCLHFHMKSNCSNCYVKGNAVVNSAQAAITVHGTHDSTVEENVLWDSVTVGVYTEDGQEMNNLIVRNVMICSNLAKTPFFRFIFCTGWRPGVKCFSYKC